MQGADERGERKKAYLSSLGLEVLLAGLFALIAAGHDWWCTLAGGEEG